MTPLPKSFGFIFNAFQFQVGWFVCVLVQGVEALVFVVFVTLLHFCLVKNRIQDGILVVVALLLGMALESVALIYELYSIHPESQQWLVGQVPHWLLLLWMLFALTLNHSMSWLKGKPWLAVMLGLMLAPLSYLAGDRFGVIHLGPNAYLWLGVLWAAAMMVLAVVQRTALPIRRISTSKSGAVQ